MKTKLLQTASIITRRNISTSITISICYHAFLLIYVVLFSSADKNYLFFNVGFLLFTLTDIVLWIICLIPLVAILRRELEWHDAYALAAMFSFICVAVAYLGYVIDPTYVLHRIFFFFPELNTISYEILIMRLAESEVFFIIFLSILLFTNHRAPRASRPPVLIRLQSVPILITGVIVLSLGMYGFMVSYEPAYYFHSVLLQMGDISWKSPEIGQARFRMLVNIAVLFFPLFWVVLVRKFLHAKILTDIIKYISILVIGIAIIPNLIYGARASIIVTVIFGLILINRYIFVIRSKHFVFGFIIMATLIYSVTVLRGNRLVFGSPKEVFYKVITRKIPIPRKYKIDVFFDFDRIVTVASIIQHVDQTGDMISGKSLISGPIKITQDILQRSGFGNYSERNIWWSASEFIKYWRFGTLNVTFGTPPSLPAEFYLQFGFLSLFILSYFYGKVLYLLRKMIIGSTSSIIHFALVAIAVNQLLIIAADISYIFGVLFYQILPILIIYGSVMIFYRKKRNIRKYPKCEKKY